MRLVGIMNDSIDLDKYSITQLRKIKENLEQQKKESSFGISDKIAKKKGTIIDEFTSIDDLLRVTIQDLQDLIMEQRETNRQMQINNKLLLALYYKEDSDGNLVQRDPMGIDTAILESISRGGAHITRVVNIINRTIGEKEIIFEQKFEGALAEVLFISSTSTTNNKSYSARIVADDNIIYEDSYTNFESRSNYETDMACFEDELNDVYLLQFQNVNFNQKVLVEVYDSSATFQRIYIKYHRSV